MRFIPTSVHGPMDYLMGVLLTALPWIAGFSDNSAATWFPVALGVGVLGYSLFTDYEWGIRRAIPMTAHLGLDMGGGVLLAASPWLLGFDEHVWVPHVVVGLVEVGTALLTQTTPGTARAADGRARPVGRGA